VGSDQALQESVEMNALEDASIDSLDKVLTAIFDYAFPHDPTFQQYINPILENLGYFDETGPLQEDSSGMPTDHEVDLTQTPFFLHLCQSSQSLLKAIEDEIVANQETPISSDQVHRIFQTTDNPKILRALTQLMTASQYVNLTTPTMGINQAEEDETGSIEFTQPTDRSDPSDEPQAIEKSGRAGEVLGAQDWTLLECIGFGGMGTVWRAKNHFGELGALKLMNSTLSKSPKLIARFQSEIHSIKKINHPNIVKLLDWGKDREQGKGHEQDKDHEHDNTRWFFVTEFIKGRPLSEVIKTGGPLSLKTLKAIFLKIANGLEVAHHEGIIHRDIKPSNIMVTPEWEPILIDFGIARRVKDTNVTKTNERLLTIKFAAPEQIYGEPVSPASDIFSLAATFSHALAPQEAMTRPRFMPDLTPKATHPLLSACLNYETEERPQSMRAFISILREMSIDDATLPEALIKPQASPYDTKRAGSTAQQTDREPHESREDSPSRNTDKFTQLLGAESTLDDHLDPWFKKAKKTWMINALSIYSLICGIMILGVRVQLIPHINQGNPTPFASLLIFFGLSFCFLIAPLYRVKIWSVLLSIALCLFFIPMSHYEYQKLARDSFSPLMSALPYLILGQLSLSLIAVWSFMRVYRARRHLKRHGISLHY
jgi:serine/threonine protein kinase